MTAMLPASTTPARIELADLKAFYEENGYAVARGLFSAEETAALREHFMQVRAEGPKPGDFAGVDLTSTDPLKRYPRLIHMHRWDEASLQWALDARIAECLESMLGTEAWLGQTMLYFKPAGARGQALHQDNWYLKVAPGTCMAAWMALDRCDTENGCMQVIPGSHRWPLLCTEKADTKTSFTDVTVPIPEGITPTPVFMEPGDVLFFNGSLVHGSFPNTTSDRFRRSLIGHYISGDAERASKWMNPLWRRDGTVFDIEDNPGGGRCGVWVDVDGTPVVELVGALELENAGATTE